MASRRPLRRPPAARRPQPLRHANALMNRGEFARSAQLFDRLAVGARRRGMPIRAANLSLRAAQAYLAQGDIAAALDRMRRTIRVLARHGQAERVAHLVSRAADELRRRGYDAQAAELTQFARGVLGKAAMRPGDPEAPRGAALGEARDSLPERCQGCGAPLLPGDVTWHDARTAECPYCGTVIKAA